MMTRKLLSLTFGCLLAAAGCTEMDGKPDESDVKGGVDGKAEAWGPSDRPEMFSSSLIYDISQLPMQGQATNIPWAGSYWPVYQDSINFKWSPNRESPSALYGRAFGVTGVEDAVSKYHGIDAQSSRTSCTDDSACNAQIGEKCAKRPGQASGRCIPTWWGICHAWTPAAILLPEPKKPVTYNGVEFKVQDIKALLTLVHDRTETKFVSLRCNEDAEGEGEAGINFDNYGRPTGDDAECKDTNPGTYHVLLTNYLGKQGASFAEDRTFDDEVWNQPLRAYRIKSQVEISAIDANKAIGVTPTGGTNTEKAGTVAKNVWVQLGSFPLTAGANFTAAMTGTGDVDLYVKFGGQPTASSYDCRPYGGDSNETCNLTAQTATTAHVAVLGYADTSTYTVKITAGGTIPTVYAFNDKAAKLYKVNTEVDYIGESDSALDGNLGTTIDRYTHTDRYDYILEVDAAGKIIGGEWLGASKRAHPDFLWLPVRASAASVAGGKITYAKVKAIYDLSMADAQPPTTGVDKVVTDKATVAKSVWKHYGPYNLAAGATLTAVMTGDGDADLYVRKNAAPTSASYDCRPYRDGSNEECSIVGPATVYVGVNGYAASSTYDLKITYKEGTGAPPVTPPADPTWLNTQGSVAQGAMQLFTMDVIAGKKIFVRTTAPADVDLYIMMDAAPTTTAYTMRAWTSSGNETITYTPTSNGKLHIGVHGYAASSFTLRTAAN